MSYEVIRNNIHEYNAKLIAVSKTKPIEDILSIYNKGQRMFGENKVQELLFKKDLLPDDIEWHLIGHLQTNKVKQILPYVYLIHSVDSEKLLIEINKEALKINRKVNVLLQIFIATEETKFGLDEIELEKIIENYNNRMYPNVIFSGLMGMASFSDNKDLIRTQFKKLKNLFQKCKEKIGINSEKFDELSMGMSGDYTLALQEGSTMVRIGSLIFGSR